MAYCVGLYKTKQVISPKYKLNGANWTGAEFIYYPEFKISNVVKDLNTNAILITITNTNTTLSATLFYSAGSNLLNTSPKVLIETPAIPTATMIGGTRDDKLEEFVKQITDYAYVPFCVVMRFYMNPNSNLSGTYSPYDLTLMTGLTSAAKENQKGELMCDVDETLIVGNDFESFVSFAKANANSTPLTTGTYDNSSFTQVDLSEIKTLKDEIESLNAKLAAANQTAEETTSFLSQFASKMSNLKSAITSFFPKNVQVHPSNPSAPISQTVQTNQTALCKFVEDTIKNNDIDQIIENAKKMFEEMTKMKNINVKTNYDTHILTKLLIETEFNAQSDVYDKITFIEKLLDYIRYIFSMINCHNDGKNIVFDPPDYSNKIIIKYIYSIYSLIAIIFFSNKITSQIAKIKKTIYNVTQVDTNLKSQTTFCFTKSQRDEFIKVYTMVAEFVITKIKEIIELNKANNISHKLLNDNLILKFGNCETYTVLGSDQRFIQSNSDDNKIMSNAQVGQILETNDGYFIDDESDIKQFPDHINKIRKNTQITYCPQTIYMGVYYDNKTKLTTELKTELTTKKQKFQNAQTTNENLKKIARFTKNFESFILLIDIKKYNNQKTNFDYVIDNERSTVILTLTELAKQQYYKMSFVDYNENHKKNKKGGGLKHKHEIKSIIHRIYRPVIQRKIDYYNYA